MIKEIKEFLNLEEEFTPERTVYQSNEWIRACNHFYSKGVMSDTEARKQNIGGEIICRVF